MKVIVCYNKSEWFKALKMVDKLGYYWYDDDFIEHAIKNDIDFDEPPFEISPQGIIISDDNQLEWCYVDYVEDKEKYDFIDFKDYIRKHKVIKILY